MEEKQARAELRHARISARKVKIVIDTIRGKNAKEKYYSYLYWIACLFDLGNLNHDSCQLD